MPKNKKRSQRFYDYSLLFAIVFLTIFGLVMIYSASSYMAQINYKGDAAHFMTRQGVIAFGGFFIMIMVSKMDYHWYARFSGLAIVVSWILMIAVSILVTVFIMFQNPKGDGLSSLAGGASFLNGAKDRSVDAKLNRLIRLLAVAFFVVTIAVYAFDIYL